LPQGQGVHIAWEASESIPSIFASAVIEGVSDAMNAGILAGMKMVDVHASIEDGSYHDVDSTADAFREAARQATTEALQQADPVLLEAMALIATTSPTGFLSEIEEAVASFGGRVTLAQSGSQTSVVEARVPAPRASDMIASILAVTEGRSTITMTPAGYEIRPEPPETIEQWVPAD
jgi:elongation factor G